VEAHTQDRIKELLVSGDITANTRFVIVNALYLYASWETLFPKKQTNQAAFHSLAGSDVTSDTMHVTDFMLYKATTDAQVVEVPYVSGNLWMTLVLPASGQFEATRAQIAGQWLADLSSSLTRTYVTLGLPKFKVVTPQLLLIQPLTDLGMGIAFEPGKADFSGITTDDPLFIRRVVQKAFIGVDEDGTEGAAATAVVGDTWGIPPTPVALTFDRPFLFFIQDKTGTVLFSGQVVDPTK
jgi:serpin B